MSLFDSLLGPAEADDSDDGDPDVEGEVEEVEEAVEEEEVAESEVVDEESGRRLRMLRHDEIADRLVDDMPSARVVPRPDDETVVVVGDADELDDIREALLREDGTFEWQRLSVDDRDQADAEALVGLLVDAGSERVEELAPATEEIVEQELGTVPETSALEDSDGEQSDDQTETDETLDNEQ